MRNELVACFMSGWAGGLAEPAAAPASFELVSGVTSGGTARFALMLCMYAGRDLLFVGSWSRCRNQRTVTKSSSTAKPPARMNVMELPPAPPAPLRLLLASSSSDGTGSTGGVAGGVDGGEDGGALGTRKAANSTGSSWLSALVSRRAKTALRPQLDTSGWPSTEQNSASETPPEPSVSALAKVMAGVSGGDDGGGDSGGGEGGKGDGGCAGGSGGGAAGGGGDGDGGGGDGDGGGAVGGDGGGGEGDGGR
eukprot:4561177-Prymnesium_polylepis.1